MKLHLLKLKKNQNLKTKNQIDIKIKNENLSKNKQASFICGKCYLYGGIQEIVYNQLLWWIELAKLSGYNGIMICNNSIPNNKKFNSLFEKHKDFIEIYQFHSFPNDMKKKDIQSDHDHIYFNYIDQLTDGINIDVLNTLVSNECYADHIEDYNYIAIFDADEIVIPREINDLTNSYNLISYYNELDDIFSNYKCISSENATPIIKHMHDVENANNLTRPVSMYFKNGMYLDDKNSRYIFQKIEQYFKSSIFLMNQFNESFRHSINVKYKTKDELSKYGKFELNYDRNFILTGQNDINYAKNLIKIYKNIYSSNRTLNYDFERFVYLYGDITSAQKGKSIHNTLSSTKTYIHWPIETEFISIDSRTQGFLSHFRHFTQQFKAQTVPITDLGLDLNYYSCYYKKILKSIDSKQ